MDDYIVLIHGHDTLNDVVTEAIQKTGAIPLRVDLALDQQIARVPGLRLALTKAVPASPNIEYAGLFRRLGVQPWAWEALTLDQIAHLIRLQKSNRSEEVAVFMSTLLLRSRCLWVDNVSESFSAFDGLPILACLLDLPVVALGVSVRPSPWIPLLSERNIKSASELIEFTRRDQERWRGRQDQERQRIRMEPDNDADRVSREEVSRSKPRC